MNVIVGMKSHQNGFKVYDNNKIVNSQMNERNKELKTLEGIKKNKVVNDDLTKCLSKLPMFTDPALPVCAIHAYL